MRVQVTLLSLLALTGSASAELKPGQIVLLPPDDPAGIADELEQALADVGRPVQRSALKLDELMLAMECSAKTIACLQKIGTNLGAAAMVIGETQKTSQGNKLTLRWFDIKSGGDAGRAETVLPKEPDQRARELRRTARTLFGLTQGADVRTGGLKITSTVPYVEVLIDGQPRGTAPLELRNLPVRKYRVEARLTGYATWSGELEVKPDQMSTLEIEMQVHAGAKPDGPRRTPGFLESIRTRTWLVAGIGAASLLGAVAFGAHMRSQQNELDETEGNTFEEIARMEELKDAGERDALAANILFGLGGALLATSAVMSYLDYRRGSTEAPSSTAVDVAVGPGSLQARITF
jgi:hypothetical protein